MKKAICCFIISILLTGILSGCVDKNEKSAAEEVQTIIIGHHYVPEDDPYWVNEITGESGMSEDNRRAAIAALNIVKEKLGVDIKWISYPSNLKQCALQSVLAGDPLCHIPIMANGYQASLLAQNVLQPLDKYKDIFDSNPDYSWLMLDKCFGHYYLLNRDSLFMNNWPLVYNATMIEEIPSLKKDGKTIYPATLYEEGKWTWSMFEWYLREIEAYYRGRKADSGNAIYPFHTNYTYTLLFALHANGANLYDGETMAFDSEEGIVAAEYLEGLIEQGLLNCLTASQKTTDTGYMKPTEAFMRGETVFNNAARWKMDDCGSKLAERGESMGVIPFPRPDDIEMDDPYEDYGKSRFKIYSSVADSVGLLRGFDEAESRLALEAYAMYRTEFYKALGHVDSFQAYKDTMAQGKAVEDGVDIFHPEIGEANLRIYKQLASTPENEFGESMDLMWGYCQDIFGKSAYGVGGAPKYRVHVQSKKNGIYKRIENIGKSLKAGDAIDSSAPSSDRLDSTPLVFPLGTKETDIDWLKYFKASDNVDGQYEIKCEYGKFVIRGANDIAKAERVAKEEKLKKVPEVPFEENRFFVDISLVDFKTVGEYQDGIIVKVIDRAGNTSERKYSCYIYDPDNKVPPEFELKDVEKTVEREADTSTVKWRDFVALAKDVNGYDIMSRVSANVEYLDVTLPGEYPVVFYVTDFAGNRTEIETVVKVD